LGGLIRAIEALLTAEPAVLMKKMKAADAKSTALTPYLTRFDESTHVAGLTLKMA